MTTEAAGHHGPDRPVTFTGFSNGVNHGNDGTVRIIRKSGGAEETFNTVTSVDAPPAMLPGPSSLRQYIASWFGPSNR